MEIFFAILLAAGIVLTFIDASKKRDDESKKDNSLNNKSMRDKTSAGLLAIFFGGLGIHKFYLGSNYGLWYILFCWTFIPALIGLIEGIGFFVMEADEFNAQYNTPIKIPEVRGSVADELIKYKQLLDGGAITQEEFECQKNKILLSE